jgi:ABC-type uncharacterized transport system involved in gliding motility auxiliary subunit|tara:strand:+ start:2744 stop:4261 length:1518 start_codon:yes stop_codon:yes gene_type:complete
MNANSQTGFSRRLRWSGWINITLAALSVLILGCVANYIAHRHFNRTSWAHNLDRELSTHTVELLRDVTNEVGITIFYDKSEPTYRMVEELLTQYVHENANLTLTTVDPEIQSVKARELLGKYRLTPQQRNVVIFDANNKSRVVTDGQLSERTPRLITDEELAELPENQRSGMVFERTAFLGERQFTSAIQAVSTKDQPIVYCVKGHGEHSITNRNSNGYSEFGKMLGEMNTLVYDLELNRVPGIPFNCDLLILAGPVTELNAKEKRMVEQYLSSQGGRMLILINHRSHGDLQNLLVRWGVNLGDNTVLDPDNTLGDGSLTIRQYWSHPVVQALQREDLPVRLLLPRTVSGIPEEEQLAAAGLEVTPLVITSPNGKAIRNFINRTQGAQPVVEIENAALSLAVAVEKDTLADVQTDHLARIMVVGDSFFMSNRMIDLDGNRDLAWHSVNWLLDRSHLMRGIGPKPITTYRFEFRQSEFRKMASLIAGIMPTATILFGLMVWLRRRA